MTPIPHKDIFTYLKILSQKQFRGFTLFFLAGLLTLLYLGTWQLNRLEEKTVLIQNLTEKRAQDPRPFEDLLQAHLQKGDNIEFAKTVVKGTLDPKWFVKLMGQTHDGRLGYDYLGLLKLDTGGYVIVNLGWVLGSRDPQTVALPQGPITLYGTVRYETHVNTFTPDNQYQSHEVFSIRPQEIQTQMNLVNVYPVYISNVVQGLVIKNGPQAQPLHLSIRNQHLNYALTWYALAIVWVLCFVFFVRRQL